MINYIKLAALRNGEYLQLIDDVLSIVHRNGTQELNVQQQYTELLALSKKMESFFKVATGSPISLELQELDLRRDKAITGLTAGITMYTYSANPALEAHAVLLQNHLSAFSSGIARENYISETATIRHIIADWDRQPELTAALNALSLGTWRTELEDANNKFEERHLARAKEKGAAPVGSVGAIRLETNDAYYALRDRINSLFNINDGAEPFGKTVSSLNSLIDKYKVLLNRRVNKGVKSGDDTVETS